MKNLKYLLLFILIFFICPNVFAQDFTVSNSDITSPNGGGRTGTYTGTEIYNSGTANVYDIGTRYNGRLSRIVFNLASGGYSDPSGFEKGHSYTLTLNMATDDWRNKFGSVSVKCEGSSGSELSNGRVTYVSYRKIKFSFTAPSDTFCQFVYVDLKSSNITSTAFTGVSNWNLSSMVISDPTYSSGGGGVSSPTPTPDGSQSIINNQNQNTQDIINNNNQNTNDIIENSNQNTQDIINNQNNNTSEIVGTLKDVCPNIFNLNFEHSFNDSTSYLVVNDSSNSFQFSTTNNWGRVTFSIPTKIGTTYYLKSKTYNPYLNDILINVLDSSNTELNSVRHNGLEPDFAFSFTATSSTTFISFVGSTTYYGNVVQFYDIMISSSNTSFCSFGSGVNKLDQTNQAINDSTNSIINNNNQNTQQQIDSQKVCTRIDKSKIINFGYLSSSGVFVSGSSTGVTDYFPLNSSSYIKTLESISNTQRLCFYDESKSFLNCVLAQDLVVGSNVTIPKYAFFVRFTINSNNDKPQFDLCSNGNQALNDSINDLTDTMKDDDIDDKTGFFTNFQDNTHGLTGIITLPLTTIQSLTNSSCASLSIPIPFTNSNVNLPCMTQVYETYIPSVYSIWQVVSFGIISYFICLDIFKIVKGFKDPNEDKIEVLDL